MSKWRRHLVSSKRLRAGATAPAQVLTGVDILHGHVCVPLVFVYKNGFDIEHAERSLQHMLQHYPLVAGRIKKNSRGEVCLDGDDSGMDFMVYQCEGPMPYGEHNPLGDALPRFYKRFLPWQVVGKDQPVLKVEIHRYDDGGIVMCVCIVHSVFDGSSFFGFMLNWSRTCRGLPIEVPSFDRSVLTKAGQAEKDISGFGLVFQPPLLKGVGIMAKLGWRAVTDMKKEIFRIPASTVQKWKDEAAVLPGAASVNAGKLVSTYVLKTLSPLMPRGVPRSVAMALDMRYVKGLSLTRDYFGNGLCYAQATFSEQELAQECLPVLAEKCKPLPEHVSASYVSKYLAVAEQHRQNNSLWRLIFQPAIDTLGGGIVQNNLSLLPIYDVDMGRGTPDWYETFAMTIRMMALVSTPAKDGGVDLHMAASRAELKALRAQLAADGIAQPR